MKKYTIYLHIFPNGKTYVGITSQLLEDRWKKGKGYKTQRMMNNAINKYGWENIKHIILEENLTEEEALDKEEYYIKLYHSFYLDNGYNIAKRGNLPPELEKPVNQYTLSGIFIETYKNITIASLKTGISASLISQNINGYRKTAGGFIWKEFEENTDNIEPLHYDLIPNKRKKSKLF